MYKVLTFKVQVSVFMCMPFHGFESVYRIQWPAFLNVYTRIYCKVNNCVARLHHVICVKLDPLQSFLQCVWVFLSVKLVACL